MLLASYHELHEYSLHHILPPAKFSALLVCDDEHTLRSILQALKQDWSMVTAMESRFESSNLLHSRCRFVLWQHFREVMTCLDRYGWEMAEPVRGVIAAWEPQLQSSANLESIFGDLSSAVKQSGRSDCGSLCNLLSVAIRSLQHRLSEDPACPEPVSLEPGDFDGPEVAALKPKIWSPSAAAPCIPMAVIPLPIISNQSSALKRTRGTKVDLEAISKPFPTTSAYMHSHASLNHYAGFQIAWQLPSLHCIPPMYDD